MLSEEEIKEYLKIGKNLGLSNLRESDIFILLALFINIIKQIKNEYKNKQKR